MSELPLSCAGRGAATGVRACRCRVPWLCSALPRSALRGEGEREGKDGGTNRKLVSNLPPPQTVNVDASPPSGVVRAELHGSTIFSRFGSTVRFLGAGGLAVGAPLANGVLLFNERERGEVGVGVVRRGSTEGKDDETNRNPPPPPRTTHTHPTQAFYWSPAAASALSGTQTAGSGSAIATWTAKGSRSVARLGSDFALGPNGVLAVSSPRATSGGLEWCGAVDLFSVNAGEVSALE